MSFSSQAGRVRDRDLPHGRRYSALRCAVGEYCPIGFDATWSYLETAGDLRADGAALLRALDMLELSRAAWIAGLDAFATRRRAEKRQHRKTPSAEDLRRLYGCGWPGPEGHRVTVREVGLLWGAHTAAQLPELPPTGHGPPGACGFRRENPFDGGAGPMGS
ncbi:hypothetical protein [Kitasatospora sp. NPDC057223]|uniref:hypothetical protein n=1 Tax=Kitasatospora sp. NPDC057223 TaxID=3346055 RepID=UPI00362E4F32